MRSFIKKIKAHEKSVFHILYHVLHLLPEGLLLIKTKDWGDLRGVLHSVEKKSARHLSLLRMENSGPDFPEILAQKPTQYLSLQVKNQKI